MTVQYTVFIQETFWAITHKFLKDTINNWREGDWPVIIRVQFILTLENCDNFGML